MTTEYPKSLWSYNPLPTGCVLFLPLWHPNMQGLVVKSPDPFGHTLTRTGGVTDAQGIVMDGDDKIALGSNTVLNMGTSDFTMAGWFYPTSMAAGAFTAIFGSSGGNSAIFDFTTSNRALTLTKPGVGSAVSILMAALNTWQFMALAFDSSEATGNAVFYLDAATDTQDFDKDFTGETDELGEYPAQADRSFIGTMGEAAIWKDRILSANEIAYYRSRTLGRYL